MIEISNEDKNESKNTDKEYFNFRCLIFGEITMRQFIMLNVYISEYDSSDKNKTVNDGFRQLQYLKHLLILYDLIP